ncbi:MAG: hypothetical protein IT242_07385 [Bacteroidia bacterium]|nr:hypothetical protein [Bacteroidia bacterium]
MIVNYYSTKLILPEKFPCFPPDISRVFPVPHHQAVNNSLVNTFHTAWEGIVCESMNNGKYYRAMQASALKHNIADSFTVGEFSGLIKTITEKREYCSLNAEEIPPAFFLYQ